MDAFVSSVEVQFKLSTDSTFISLGSSSTTIFEILDLAAGTYDVRARSLTNIGSTSSFTSTQVTVSGLAAAPTAMANLSVNQVGGLAVLQWDQSTDLDVRVGGRVDIRFQSVTTGADLVNSTLVDDSVPGIATSALVPLREGTYLLRFVDSSGTAQTTATSVVTTGATILAFSPSTTVTESPTFGGTKTNLFVDDADTLQLTSDGNLDAQTDFDAIANFDLLGNINTSGTYEFLSNMDLSSKTRVRLTANLTVSIVNALDLIDSRSSNIDDWADFDGTAGAVANIIMSYASTDDDPSGSPSFSAFKEFTQTEEEARAFKFKASFVTDDPAYNIKCSAMSVKADII